MAGSYTRLPSIHESQDIAEYSSMIEDAFGSQERLNPQPQTAPDQSFSQIELRDLSDRKSVRSFDTEYSQSSTSTNFDKLKTGWNRIRRKPVSSKKWKGSIRRHPAAEIEPTRIGRGIWKDQLLVDRSLRTMALLMVAFAIAMFIVICVHLSVFTNRPNKFTSSVGGEPQDCKTVTRTNTALLLLINVAATMVLGMSNTYQQLVTSLKVQDLKHMLHKFGDSRVGTNSPFNINHKASGKKRAWAAWMLLISTSMPIHFLANSLIGPSSVIMPPTELVFNETSYVEFRLDNYFTKSGRGATPEDSYLCWSAFRTGKAHFAEDTYLAEQDDASLFASDHGGFGAIYTKMTVNYASENCTGLARSATDKTQLLNERIRYGFATGNCSSRTTMSCHLSDSRPPQCRLNVRMNAAFILLFCLISKATYMVLVNFRARNRRKEHCLTFGDVIIASASNPELRVQGECMVNANDSYRRSTSHTCHKHCKNKEESKTGDELGHCQECKKWNTVDKFINEPQPTIVTKIKKSLISNLGNTALTQLCLLMFCSLVLLIASVMVAVVVGMGYDYDRRRCEEGFSTDPLCDLSEIDHFSKMSGGFGGFNKSLILHSLPPDKLGNEILSFCISNGAQFIYSLLYLMMIYNITLVSQENDWGKLERRRERLRCTLVMGDGFYQDYLLQLPKIILFPIMAYSVLTHWMLGEALQTQELIWKDVDGDNHVEHSRYIITYAAYPLWFATFLILLMTGVCWWAFTYKREGFMPQMFGSIRVLCASTTVLDDFPSNGVRWGDLGFGKQFRHAGLSADKVDKIKPHELYAGTEAVAECSQSDPGEKEKLGDGTICITENRGSYDTD